MAALSSEADAQATPAVAGRDSSDAAVLLELKSLLHAPEALVSWDKKRPLEEWYGTKLTMDAMGAMRVESLHLENCDLEVGLETWARVLSTLPELHTLDLRFNSRLRGNVRSLAPVIPKLKMLAFSKTGISGSLEEIAAAHGAEGRLEVLWAGDSQLTGDVLSLGAFANTIIEVNLQNTKVTGNLNHFRGRAPHLKKISLTNTRIEGSLSNLTMSCPSVTVLAVAKTNLSPVNIADLRTVAQKLRMLKARGSGITATEEEKAMFEEAIDGCICDVDIVEADPDAATYGRQQELVLDVPEMSQEQIAEQEEPQTAESVEERATQYDEMAALGIDIEGYDTMAPLEKANQKLLIARYLNDNIRHRHATAAAEEGLEMERQSEEKEEFIRFGLEVELAVSLDARNKHARAIDAAEDALCHLRSLEDRGYPQEQDVHARLRLILGMHLLHDGDVADAKTEARRGLSLSEASNQVKASLMLLLAKVLVLEKQGLRAEDCLAHALRLASDRPEGGQVHIRTTLELHAALAGVLLRAKQFDECAMIAHNGLVEAPPVDELVRPRIELIRWLAGALVKKGWHRNALHQALTGLRLAVGEHIDHDAPRAEHEKASMAADLAEVHQHHQHKNPHFQLDLEVLVELYRIVAICSFKLKHFQDSVKASNLGIRLGRSKTLTSSLELKETLGTLRWYLHNAAINQRNQTVKNRGPGWLACADVKPSEIQGTYRLSELPRGDVLVSHFGESTSSPHKPEEW